MHFSYSPGQQTNSLGVRRFKSHFLATACEEQDDSGT